MNRDKIKQRSTYLTKVRSFFEERKVLEVDCPNILSYPAIDTHIDSMSVEVSDTKTGYLHTSPEYFMKKLLSQGSGDIYYLGHVYRKEEIGDLHNPEFTMIEWYRLNFSLKQMIKETIELLSEFLGIKKTQVLSYREAFLKYLQIDPFAISLNDLQSQVKKLGYEISLSDKDSYFDLLLSHEIESRFPKDLFVVLTQYPPSQAALAQIEELDNLSVAQRFEVYYQGVELANGYKELNSSKLQRSRFIAENLKRKDLGKSTYPIDEEFLDSLDNLPDCSGVSIGFDRVIALAQKKKNIHEVSIF